VRTYVEATAEIPCGTTFYPVDGVQVPGLAWADVTGESNFTERNEKLWHGVTVANTGRYSYAFSHNLRQAVTTLLMMVARGNLYTYSDRPGIADVRTSSPIEPGGGFALEDEGIHELEYAIVPHIEGWREGLTHRRAVELNRPLIVITESAHLGTLPPEDRDGRLSISNDNIVLGALKWASSKDAVIARFYEAHRALTRGVKIRCFGVEFEADFKPGEIKCFRVDVEGGEGAKGVSLLEEPAHV